MISWRHDNQIVSLVFEDTEDAPSQLKYLTGKTGPFYNNNITGTLVIPSNVIEISDSTFYNNPNLTEFIVKRTAEDAIANMDLAYNWNVVGWISDSQTSIVAKVTYNPDYTE